MVGKPRIILHTQPTSPPDQLMYFLIPCTIIQNKKRDAAPPVERQMRVDFLKVRQSLWAACGVMLTEYEDIAQTILRLRCCST
jgi:hypothetical protein